MEADRLWQSTPSKTRLGGNTIIAHEYLRDRAHSHPAYLINELRQETAFKYLAWHWVARGFEVAEREEDFIAGKGLGVFPVDGVKQPRSGGIY